MLKDEGHIVNVGFLLVCLSVRIEAVPYFSLFTLAVIACCPANGKRLPAAGYPLDHRRNQEPCLQAPCNGYWVMNLSISGSFLLGAGGILSG